METGPSVVKGGVLPTPSASLGGSSPLESALGWPQPRAAALPVSGHGPVPAPPTAPLNCLEVAFPFLSLKRRRRGHLPTAGVAEVPGAALGRIPRGPQPGAGAAEAAVPPAQRPRRGLDVPGGEAGARRGQARVKRTQGSWGKFPNPAGGDYFPAALLGTRPAGEEAPGAGGGGGKAASEKTSARPRWRGRCCAYTF